MGKIGNGLDKLLIFLRPHFIEHQCQDDGAGKADDQPQHRQGERVAKDAGEFAVGEEADEMLEAVLAGPGTAPDAQAEAVILKSDLNARHGNIFEHNVVNRYRQEKQVKNPVALHQLPGLRPGAMGSSFGMGLGEHPKITRLPFAVFGKRDS